MSKLNAVIDIIKQQKLEEFFKYFTLENKANFQPYHNWYHAINVISAAYHIAAAEGLTNAPTNILLLAAMFHDVNHSGGLHADKFNVASSIQVFNNIADRIDRDSSEIFDMDQIKHYVAHTINATEYPYTIAEDNLNISQKILRDADMSQIFTDNYFQQNVMGLGKEIGMPLLSFIPVQLKFLDSLKFLTDYGNTYFKPKLDIAKSEVKGMWSILDPKTYADYVEDNSPH